MRSDLEALARAAGVDLETYTLARVVASEAGSSSSTDLERVGVAHATLNRVAIWANRDKYLDAPITARVTLEEGRGPTWEYGPQNVGPRVVSTRFAPTANHLAVARLVIRGEVPDPTGGAQSFLEPSGQDKLLAAGVAGYKSSASTVLRRWMADGWQPTVMIDNTLFLRKGTSPAVDWADHPDPPRRDGSSFLTLVVGAGLIGAAAWLLAKG